MVFRILTLVLNVEDDQMASSRLDEVFKISTSVLNIEGDQMASSGLDEVFKILTSISNVEDYEPSSIRWSSSLSRCFIWTSIVSSGVLVVADLA